MVTWQRMDVSPTTSEARYISRQQIGSPSFWILLLQCSSISPVPRRDSIISHIDIFFSTLPCASPSRMNLLLIKSRTWEQLSHIFAEVVKTSPGNNLAPMWNPRQGCNRFAHRSKVDSVVYVTVTKLTYYRNQRVAMDGEVHHRIQEYLFLAAFHYIQPTYKCQYLPNPASASLVTAEQKESEVEWYGIVSDTFNQI